MPKGQTQRKHPAAKVEGDRVVLRDARAIRAVAHPVRLAVVDELFSQDVERTATELATLTGITPSAMSYHLRALERFGILTRGAPTGDGRPRRWRAVARNLGVESRGIGTATAESAMLDLILAGLRDRWTAWVSASRPAQWESAAALSRARVWLTAEEASALQADIQSLLTAYRPRRSISKRPPDAQDVEIVYSILPDPDTDRRTSGKRQR